jgi:hypothetical protein
MNLPELIRQRDELDRQIRQARDEVWERRDRQRYGMRQFLRTAPHEPRATLAEVLEVPCPVCGAEAGTPCSPKYRFASGMVFGEAMRDVHLRRYLDKTHDPR